MQFSIPKDTRVFLRTGVTDLSIVGTCKLINVNPEAYLTWVLPKLAAATTKTTDGLLPHDFAERQLD